MYLYSYFKKSLKSLWGVTFSHKLQYSLVVVPRDIVLLKFENIKRGELY